jgi:signal transduction histidine kinase
MLDRLHGAFNRERQFVDDASHELRTPLTILKTELELALSRPRTPPELEGALRSASEETDRLAALAEDLLLYSRADGGRIPVYREEVRLDDVLRRAVATHDNRSKAAGVSIDVQAPEEIVRVDVARLRQAVDNLMTNALRHTPPGGHILVRGSRKGAWVRLEFEDSGSGFPPGFIQRAFEPFARGAAKRAEAPEGAGLGLAIVRAVAEAHGGRATAENRPDGGARVTLSLRVAE